MKSMIGPILSYTLSTFMLLAAATACTMPGSMAKTANATVCSAGVSKGASQAGIEQITLCIESGKKTHSFTVEAAKTSMQQAQGLMFRTSLADNAGMIFPFPDPRPASFWMKNTVIPLDIIFIRANGTIESIAQNTVPYSTDQVSSGEPVAAVLELRGGLTGEMGIAPGDKVTWKGR